MEWTNSMHTMENRRPKTHLFQLAVSWIPSYSSRSTEYEMPITYSYSVQSAQGGIPIIQAVLHRSQDRPIWLHMPPPPHGRKEEF